MNDQLASIYSAYGGNASAVVKRYHSLINFVRKAYPQFDDDCSNSWYIGRIVKNQEAVLTKLELLQELNSKVFLGFSASIEVERISALRSSCLETLFYYHGGVYKVIDEYRELLQFIKCRQPMFEEALAAEKEVCSYFLKHDQFLQKVASLMSSEIRCSQSATQSIRPFPLFNTIDTEVSIEVPSDPLLKLKCEICTIAHQAGIF